jgi:hypothetical protein
MISCHQIFSGDQIKGNDLARHVTSEMWGTGKRKIIMGFDGKTWRKETTWKH